VIILLTDGVNNRGEIDPKDGAQLAQLYGIKVYTIGVGRQGYAPYPVQTPFGTQMQQMQVEIDEALLTNIADATGGKYFRATDNTSLKNIYDQIDKMEKTAMEVTQIQNRTERFQWLVVIAIFCLFAEFLIRNVFARSIP
jgi:Ca-activated chloride channel family protein